MWDEFCKYFSPSSEIYEPLNAKDDLLELADNFDEFGIVMKQLSGVSKNISDILRCRLI